MREIYKGVVLKLIMNKINSQLAELTGAMMGDGCLSIIKSGKRKRKTALLTGHLQHDYEYYKEVIRPIVKKEFNIEGYLKKRKERNCVYFIMGNGVFDFLDNLNFPIGKKINLFIPKAILEKEYLTKACIRGIFNTDGTIYRRYSKKYNKHTRIYDYLVIQFKLKSKITISQIKEALKKFGINSNKITNELNKYYILRITNQEDIKNFMESIKPSNLYHVERYINRCKKNEVYGPLAQSGGALESLKIW